MVRINLLFYFLIVTASNSFTQYSNIAVTTNSYDQSEPTIAISPLNSNIVLAAWNDARDDNTSKPGFAFSTNAGQTWAEGITLPPGYSHGFDPSVAFDRNGNAFYCYIAKDPDLSYGRVYVSKTTTFQPPLNWDTAAVSDRTFSQDKPWMSVDNTGGTYDGRLYFSWTDFYGGSKIKFRYSSDHGATFSNEIVLSVEEDEDPGFYASINPWYESQQGGSSLNFVQASISAIAPNGNVYVMWMDFETDPGNASYLKIKKSTNGGASFGSIVTAVAYIYKKLNFGSAQVSNIPSLAIDLTTGNLYAVYIDFPSSTSPYSRVKFIRSINGGSSWSTPVVISDLGVSTDRQYFPCISVDGSGRISVLFVNYSPPLSNIYITESYDGGNSFRSPIKITTQGSNPYNGSKNHHYHGITNIETSEKLIDIN